jgi:UDP-N-acetylmuramoyl-L-alanyl-D-glutamate--2,6-diaminopimelate ligase
MILETLTAGIPGHRDLVPGLPEDASAAEIEISDVVYRSDAVSPGALFCCLRGTRADGHDFAPAALQRGASALMVERELPLPAHQVVVDDARLGMALAAARLQRDPSQTLQVVGVTGTNGKTTCAFLIHAVLAAAGLRPGLLGTVEARVGGVVEPLSHTTPESADLQRLLARMRDAGDLSVAMEVSSHALVQRRAAGVRFAAALFTNLTRDHLDYHPDVEDYYLAKRRLFVRPPGEGADPPAAANLDDPYGRRLAEETGALGFSTRAGVGEVNPLEVRSLVGGISARFATPRGPVDVQSPLQGHFNLSNLAGVVATAELLGLDHAAVASGIADLRGVPGRLEAIDAGQPFQVLVDYAHTPDSLENVLVAARELAGAARLGVVFGCGGDRDAGKRPLMGEVARRLSDYAVVTSDNPRGEDPDAIIEQILAGARGGPAEVAALEDRRAAIALAVRWARPGDVLVIAGKGHESGQERRGVVTPYDDRATAREVLAEVLG